MNGLLLILLVGINPGFHWANHMRARAGLPPLILDPQLQVEAEQNCLHRAKNGIGGHDTSVPLLKCSEGVGTSSGLGFNTCFLYTPKACHAGAASYYANGRYYHTLRIKNPGSSGGGYSNNGRHRRLFRRR